MPAICTATVSPNNCGHRTHTVTWLGVTYAVQRNPEPLTEAERQQFLDYTARILEHDSGVTASAFLNRILHGDEATNVKISQFFGPGAALARSNIGATPVNLLPGANGEPIFADFTGCTKFKLQAHVNIVNGVWGAQVIRADGEVLFTSANLGAAGERELDTGWVDLPAAFVNAGLTEGHGLRVQIASGASASAVFRGLRVGLR